VSGVEEGAIALAGHDELFPAASLRAPRDPVGWAAWRLRDAVVTRELGIEDVVSAHLARLEEVEPTLGAAVFVRRDAALREASDAQALLDDGAEPGPLCGVPITVKDIIATEGTPTRCGSGAFAGNVPEVDAVAVQRLRAAGAIVIAKTNCPEFAFGITTENEAHGITHSPWGAHSPGGSSGGEAALVAAEASALGIGSDYGGSVRWPAQCCGVLALRPGAGAVDGTGQLPERGGRMDGRPGTASGPDSVQRQFQVIGPIARTVRDLAIAFGVLGGRGVVAGAGDLRIGWLTTVDGSRVAPDVESAVRAVAAELSAAGVAVEEATGTLDGLHSAFNELRDTDPLADLRAALGTRRALVGAAASLLLDAAPVSSADPAPLQQKLAHRRARVLERLQRTPVLVLPVAPAAACGLEGTALVEGELVAGFGLMAQCRAVSALGCPALSIPVVRDRRGLPLSVQVVAGPGQEGLVLSVGLVLERLLGGRQAPPWRAP
jgi:amidase